MNFIFWFSDWMLFLFHPFFIRWLLDSKSISMVPLQLPALTYSALDNILKIHYYYLIMCVYICAKLIKSMQYSTFCCYN